MVADETPASRAQAGAKRHDYALPHSHGGVHGHAHDHARPHVHLAVTTEPTSATFAPAFSILRTSIFVRLGYALFAAILVWAAFDWATR